MAHRSIRARLTLPALVAAAAGISAGSALAAPAWLPGSTLSDASGGAIDPSVAVAPGGEVVALWSQAPAFQIQAAIRPPGGSFSTATPISAAGAPIATLDHIAVDGMGNFLAVWRRNDGTNERIEFADRPAGGTFATGQHITPDAGSGFETLPDVALDPAGDAFVVFLTKPGADRLATIATRTVGGAFTIQVLSAAGQSLPLSDPPVIAAGAAGDAVALWTRSDGAKDRIQASYRAPGGTFSAGADISAAGFNASFGRVAVDGSGNAVAVWQRNSRVEAAIRPAGGVFGTPVPISDPGQPAGDAAIAMDAQGNAMAVWDRSDGTKTIAQAALRPAGAASSFGPAVSLSAAGQNAQTPHVAMDPAGDAVVTWKRSDGTKVRIQAAARPAGGSFGAAQDVSAAGQSADLSFLAMDSQGNAASLFVRSDGSVNRATVAGYDGAGPLLGGLTIPAAGTVGTALPFSVAPVDVWSAVASTDWTFGDGGLASGSSVSHAYAAAGGFPATVTSTDALGNASTGSGQVAVTAAPTPPSGNPPPIGNPTKSLACAVKKTGTPRADKLTGSALGDLIHGGKGNDTISGRAGDDCLFGDAGNDKLSGGAGRDKLSGGVGNDRLDGGPGKDTFSGGAGRDTINSADHVKETVNCGAGRDTVKADRNDKLIGCERVRRVR